MSKYQAISEAPVAWRSVRGVPLQVYQLNQIVMEAEASDEPFPKALGLSRAAFESTHEVDNGQWITKGA